MTRSGSPIRILPGKVKIDDVDVGYDEAGAILIPRFKVVKLHAVDHGGTDGDLVDVLLKGMEWEIYTTLLQTDETSMPVAFWDFVTGSKATWPGSGASVTQGYLMSGSAKKFEYLPDGDDFTLIARNAIIYFDPGSQSVMHPEEATSLPIFCQCLKRTAGGSGVEFGPA